MPETVPNMTDHDCHMVLNVYKPRAPYPPLGELLQHGHTELRFTDQEFFMEAVPAAPDIAWRDLHDRTKELFERVKAFDPGLRPSTFYAWGFAPLQVWFHFGLLWGSWAKPPVLLNPAYKSLTEWDRIALDAPTEAKTFFGAPKNIPESVLREDGIVAVFISVLGGAPDPVNLRRLADEQGKPLLATVEMIVNQSFDAKHAPVAAQELEKLFSSISAQFPLSGKLMVCIKGPVTLAFTVGRAINPNLYASIHVPYHQGVAYQKGLELDLWGRASTASGSGQKRGGWTGNGLLDALKALLAAQFKEIVFRLAVDEAVISGDNSSQSERAIDVIKWLKAQDRLDDLAAELEKLGHAPG